MPKTQELYDQDFNLWAEETAAALRARRVEAVDIDHVAEEIEEMGKRNKRELGSRRTQILEHLLKLHLAKGLILEYNQGSWRASILRQQAAIDSLLRESPSLGRLIDPELIEACYQQAAAVVAEYGVEPPAQCPVPVGRRARAFLDLIATLLYLPCARL
jgi:Domain of unknown function DUF29